jgi:quinol monooxygenase YgiN
MIHSIVATLKAKAGCEADLKATALQLVAAVRAHERGCLLTR